MTTMTRAERNDLILIVRKRERVMKAATVARSAELLADFEAKLGAIYSYDQDEVWRAARNAATEAVEKAKTEIAERCAELGIPKEFAPGIEMGWYGRGESALANRRAEHRKMASTRIVAMEKAAKAKIETYSLEAQTELVREGLTSEAAHKFLTEMPSVEALMPIMAAEDVRNLIEDSR